MNVETVWPTVDKGFHSPDFGGRGKVRKESSGSGHNATGPRLTKR